MISPVNQERPPSDAERLAGLENSELGPCLIAERVLGCRARAWDVAGRQGAVDAMLDLVGGRTAAFEVIRLADQKDLQAEAIMRRDGYRWRLPGCRWGWSIRIDHPRHIPRLRGSAARIAQLCEAAEMQPEQLWQAETVDPDIAWLIEETASTMHGTPTPRRGDDGWASVLPAATGGAVDETLSGLAAALAEAFTRTPFPAHFAKLARTAAHERHLYVPVHWSALPFPVSCGLMFGTQPPPLPQPVSHLWLDPQYSRRLLLWSPAGWSEHDPYN